MLETELIYEARQNDNLTFLTQVLFEIDSNIQLHLQSCKENEERTDVNDNVLVFTSSHFQIQTEKFSHAIPECLFKAH